MRMKVLYLPLAVATAWAIAVFQSGNSSRRRPNLQPEIPDGFSFGVIEWRGFADFGADQVFTGTIEDVIRQMRQLKGTEYTPDFAATAEAKAKAKDEANNRTLSSKANNPDHRITDIGIECGGPAADPRRIYQGIDYLEQLPDSVVCENRARSCGRISCSWRSGIVWCNERARERAEFRCSLFAAYAAVVVDECAIYDTNPRVSGRCLDSRLGLSVVVEKSNC